MMIKMHMIFEVDLPTMIQKQLAQEFEGEAQVREEWRLNGKELVRLCPSVHHWMLAHGYTDTDLILTVGTKQENETVEKPVAQHSPV